MNKQEKMAALLELAGLHIELFGSKLRIMGVLNAYPNGLFGMSVESGGCGGYADFSIDDVYIVEVDRKMVWLY